MAYNSFDFCGNYFMLNQIYNLILSIMKFFLIVVFSCFSSLIVSLEGTIHKESIVLGSGCFWGAEKTYENIPGVIEAISGYADGKGVAPRYKEITKYINKYNLNNFAEVVKVVFDPNTVKLEEILIKYFETHDPTQLNRQGNDIGTQYRSIILTINKQQTLIAQNLINEYQSSLSSQGFGLIVTKIKPLEEFFEAEEYHQDYLVKNPNGYCPDHSTGVKFKEKILYLEDNSSLLKGKHILVVESESYCPYCEKFKENVISLYEGSIPVNFRVASQLHGLKIKTKTWVTPTILFLQNGKEIYGKQGYMTPEEFYKVLGAIKLGNSEAFRVAFNEGTDARYCKEYEIFKNTPDGTFVDKLSGAALFDTRHRFNSGTGWLSFTKPVEDSVIERPDNSFGMKRIEITSKTSGIHLGHVFPDGPKGKPRYCINASVLDFKPRDS